MHSNKALNVFSEDVIAPLISLATTYLVLSFSQLAISTLFKIKRKSAKKMLKNNGISIEPSGTPKIISNQELKVLFTFAFCYLCGKQLWTSFNAGKLNSYALSLVLRSSLSRKSKALTSLSVKHQMFYPYQQHISIFPTKPKDNAAYYNLSGSRIVASVNVFQKSKHLYKHGTLRNIQKIQRHNIPTYKVSKPIHIVFDNSSNHLLQKETK